MASLPTDLFDYPLPDRLIAQQPTDRRDASRLLVVHRREHRIEHRHFRDLPGYLRAGDCLYRNNAAVIPARLHATRPTRGHVECLLLRPASSTWSAGDLAREGLSAAGSPRLQGKETASEWWCLVRPGKKLPVGATFGLAGFFSATIREKTDDGLVRVAFDPQDGDILARCAVGGKLPPLAIAIEVEEAFLHCPKCVLRSKLWDSESWEHKDDLTFAQIARDHVKLTDVPVEVVQKALDKSHETLY